MLECVYTHVYMLLYVYKCILCMYTHMYMYDCICLWISVIMYMHGCVCGHMPMYDHMSRYACVMCTVHT